MRVNKFRLECFLQVVCLIWISKPTALGIYREIGLVTTVLILTLDNINLAYLVVYLFLNHKVCFLLEG